MLDTLSCQHRLTLDGHNLATGRLRDPRTHCTDAATHAGRRHRCAPATATACSFDLPRPGDDEIVVDIEWSGISTGTERLLWSGRMPRFPGMGYPLVPGYESVGRVVYAGPDSGRRGWRTRVRSRRALLRRGARPVRRRGVASGRAGVARGAGRRRHRRAAVLLALAATARHALGPPGSAAPDLIVGHGVLGRLLARLSRCCGGVPPVVWESNPRARGGAQGYEVIDPEADPRRDYRGDLRRQRRQRRSSTRSIERLAPGGEIVLAGFYSEPLSFALRARLHARGAHPRRRRVAREPTSPTCARWSRPAACRSTA